MPSKVWNLRISDDHLAIVLGAVAKLSWESTNPIIHSIHSQMQAQAEAEKAVSHAANDRPAPAEGLRLK